MERQWRSVGALGVLASVLVGLVGLVDIVQTAAAIAGRHTEAVLLTLAFVVALAAAGPIFLVWLWQVRANAELVAGRQSQRLRRGWGIWAWFVPVVNLWFPCQYVLDVWRASAPSRDVNEAAVLTWWLSLLGTCIVAGYQKYDTDHSIALLACALDVVAAVGLVLVIRRISGWQADHIRAGI
jgi:hypothetical protein